MSTEPDDCIALEMPFNSTQYGLYRYLKTKVLASVFIEECRVTVYLLSMLLPPPDIAEDEVTHRLWAEINLSHLQTYKGPVCSLHSVIFFYYYFLKISLTFQKK